MATTAHHHRAPASGNKKSQPPLHSRSSSKSSVSLAKSKSLSSGKLSKLGKQKDERSKQSLSSREEDEMAASFPNFWCVFILLVVFTRYCLVLLLTSITSTVCDKQIHHPELSILYCSKA